MYRNPQPTSKIQPHRQLQLSRSKRSCRLHKTRRLLKISRIVSGSRLLRVLDELACRIVKAVVGQPQPLVVAIHNIERLRHQPQMAPPAEIHLSRHPQVHGRVVRTQQGIAPILRQTVAASLMRTASDQRLTTNDRPATHSMCRRCRSGRLRAKVHLRRHPRTFRRLEVRRILLIARKP